MNKERLELYAHLTVTLLGLGIVAFLFFKYLFVAIMPFVIAWVAAYALRPLAVKVSRKTHIPIKIVGALLTILCVLVGIGVIILFLFFVVKEAREFFSAIASDERVIDILTGITGPLGSFLGEGEGAGALTEHVENAIEEGIGSLVSRLVDILSGIAASIPGVLFFILVAVIAAVYFSLDIDRVNAWIKRVLPEKWTVSLIKIKNGCLSVGVRCFRSYMIILGITFFIMLLGLLILRIRSAILISVIIALLDFLPVIGVGTVLVPWSIIELLLGNTVRGVGLIILLVFHEMVRQLVEPKIVGTSLGIHPIVSLMLLYIGYFIFGVIGILLIPVLAVALGLLFNKAEAEN